MRFYFPVLCIAFYAESSSAQTQNLVTNLRYRLSQGDLGEIVPAPFKDTRTLGIAEGGDTLLQTCLSNPAHWKIDPLLFRFAHTRPLSTIGCRERTSPSMHIVFFPSSDGSHHVTLHFDLYGPHRPLMHLTEVLKNRLTFGRTSQYDVHRNLVKSQHDGTIPSRRYDYAAHSQAFLDGAFSPKVIASAMFTAAARATLDRSGRWGDGSDRYTNRFAANLTRQTLRQTIEFGAGALLQQDEAFNPTQEGSTGHRIKLALYHSVFVPGRYGNEFAFPRLAAAMGTGFVVANWHPWQQRQINPWIETSNILSRYVVQSFWQEFKPDLKQLLKKSTDRLRRTGSHSLTADPATAPPPTPAGAAIQDSVH